MNTAIESFPLPADFARARQAFATRRVPSAAMKGLLPGPLRPAVGDLVLARVEKIGQHKQSELVNGRKATLHPGDLVILAYGNRYAPDQFEAFVPLDLGPCRMIAGGGLAGRDVARHASMAEPTAIRPLGLLCDGQGGRLNLRDYALPAAPQAPLPPVVVVCGSSMNAGKTHSAAMIIRGLCAQGYRVGACKVTGTGSGNDLWKMHDAGALRVLDFVDAGWPSTYLTPLPVLERIYTDLIAHTAIDMNVVVVEIADGLGQAETAHLLRCDALRQTATALVYAAPDPMAAAAGERWLVEAGLPLVALSGLVTARAEDSEETRALVKTPVLSAGQLALGDAMRRCIDPALRAVA